MPSIGRRLSALEQAEWDRLYRLPPREWFAGGYVNIGRLPDPERAELEAILDASFNARGYLDHTRLSPDQQRRGGELLRKLLEMVDDER